jgi:hypothetical protein
VNQPAHHHYRKAARSLEIPFFKSNLLPRHRGMSKETGGFK